MTRVRPFLVAMSLVAFCAVAAAQNADRNSGGPTANSYRLKVVEPREGAVVAAPGPVRVVVGTEALPEVGGERRDTNSTPRPEIQVFVDNTLKGTLKEANNVLELNDVASGDHKLVVLALNRSGEIIDRKEINFVRGADTVAATAPDTSARPATSNEVAAPPPAPVAEAPRTRPAPAPAPLTGTIDQPTTTAERTTMETLPETGSSDPLFAAAGIAALLAGGYALRRRS